MNKEESLALYARGRDAWNAWAKEMLVKRAALEAEGEWVEGSNARAMKSKRRDWDCAAAVDFSNHIFEQVSDFARFHFPGKARFFKTTFSAEARFREAVFSNDAGFLQANFSDGAIFQDVAFSGEADFSYATFSRVAAFDAAAFSCTARFTFAKFKGIAYFCMSTFSDAALFQQAIFKGYTFFGLANFEGITVFNAIEAKSAFELMGAKFRCVPYFIQAHFAEAPRLDDIRIEQQSSQRGLCSAIKKNFRIAKKLTRVEQSIRRRFLTARWMRAKTWLTQRRTADPDRAARWRALKRLAIQEQDHARELEYFRGELLARRWGEDTPRHAVFWFGLFYQVLSDFGRSIMRPIAWWLGSVGVFGLIYAGLRPAVVETPWPGACGSGGFDALQLSFHKGLLGFGQVPRAKIDEIYGCLYGVQPGGAPVVPDCATWWGFVQYPLSAVLIFLILLAVRNHFRIK
jgi:uncharacterized protein YjbI with pentapeptide repeats